MIDSSLGASILDVSVRRRPVDVILLRDEAAMSEGPAIEIDQDGWARYRLPVAVRQGDAPAVRRQLVALIDSAQERFRIDMGELEVMDSSGLTLLMSFLATLGRERPGTEVAFEGLSPHMMRLMGMVRPHDFDLRVQVHGAAR